MINEKITLINNKKYEINPIFKNINYTDEFTKNDYLRLKVLHKISKLEELKDIDKISKYNDAVIITDNKPSFNFLRQDIKCLNNQYIAKTNYGNKNRSKKFSTLFKKHLNLNLFTENLKKKKIKIENNFPSNFDEINEQIELKEIENISSMNRYSLNNKTNKLILNQKELWNDSNYLKSTRASTTKYQRNSYENNLTQQNMHYIKRNMEKTRLIKSAKKEENIEYENIVNLKLVNKKINSRNITNIDLSNNTKSFISFSKSQSNNKNYTKNSQSENRNSFFIKRNNNYNCKTSRAELKKSNKLIKRIMNDGIIIDKYINSNRLRTRKGQNKIDKESILLKLQERLKRRNNKKIKKQKKKEDLTDEELFSKKLKLVPGFAKKFFRGIYNRILFENRILNKNEVLNMKTVIEKQYERKRLIEELKKTTIKRMRITNDNIITEKDDKILFDEMKKVLNFYGNLDGLEWLIMKRNIITYGKKYH